MNAIVVLVFQLISALLFQTGGGVVAGRLVSKEGKPLAGIAIRLFTAPEGFGVRIAAVQTDDSGRFRLENVPEGHYYVAAGSNELLTYFPGVPEPLSATIVEVRRGETTTVKEFPLTGLKVAGNAVVERNGPLPRIALTLTSASGRVFSLTKTPSPDGTFELTLPEGEWRAAWDSAFPLPMGYTLKTLRYGAQDLLRQPLKVGSSDTVTLNIAFAAAKDSWVKVEGHVTGIDPTSRGYEVVLVADSAAESMTTDMRRDGSFEISKVPPGVYTLHLMSVGGVPLSQSLVVGNRNLTNVKVAAPPQREISGTAMIEGAGPGPLVLRFLLTRGAKTMLVTAVSAPSDGSFKVALPEGESQIALLGIAPEAIREFRYGSTDLRREPLRIAWAKDYEFSVNLAPGVHTEGLGSNVASAPRADAVVDGVKIKAPTPLMQPTPHYSQEARDAKIVGAVILETLIREDGSQAVVRVIRSLGYGLDEQAIAAIEQWRFRPATQDGVPIAVQSLIEVSFKLR